MRALLLLVVCGLWLPFAASAQDLRALARLDVAASSIVDVRGGVEVTLVLSQAVPWRVLTRDDPRRVILDFQEIAWAGVSPQALGTSKRVQAVRIGTFRPGWSRMVLELTAPLIVDTAGMRTDPSSGAAVITLRLARTDAAGFAQAVAARPPEADLWALPAPVPQTPKADSGDTIVVLDPGHGGIDPGAQRDGLREADLMLTFAREVEEALIRQGGYQVILTRTNDVFVPLAERVAIARAAKADVFLSLHADAITQGEASGATVYTLSDQASDPASAQLAERKSREDVLLGADVTEKGDQVADILMDLARVEVTPRADALADALVEGLRGTVGRLHKRPRLEAEFAVLKAPDVPSVLLEVGFMSDAQDLSDLQKPQWRAQVALGIVQALEIWVVADALRAERVRQ